MYLLFTSIRRRACSAITHKDNSLTVGLAAQMLNYRASRNELKCPTGQIFTHTKIREVRYKKSAIPGVGLFSVCFCTSFTSQLEENNLAIDIAG